MCRPNNRSSRSSLRVREILQPFQSGLSRHTHHHTPGLLFAQLYVVHDCVFLCSVVVVESAVQVPNSRPLMTSQLMSLNQAYIVSKLHLSGHRG